MDINYSARYPRRKSGWQKEYSPILAQIDKTGKANVYNHKSGALIAEADGNQISISASGEKKIRLYFSLDMFAFSKQIKVRINGNDFINIKLDIDKTVMLNEFEKTKNRALLQGDIWI